MTRVSKKRVGILRGGPSEEHHFSLASGAHILDSIDREVFHPVDIYIDKKGVWHIDGVAEKPFVALKHIDVIFNAMHGSYGEDGLVQKILEDAGVPYIGTDSFSSRIAIDKHASKLIAKQHGILTPRHEIVRPHTKELLLLLTNVWRTMHHPIVVKPIGSGSSVGVEVVRSYIDLEKKVIARAAKGETLLLEEFVEGREVSVAVIEDMRGEKHYTPIALEIKHDAEFFSHEVKANHSYKMEPMFGFSEEERRTVSEAAVLVHKALGLKHFSRADFLINKSGIYFIEVNTIPGMTKHSIFPAMLRESGISMTEFIRHILTLALRR
jgi:D-alanine-D-alanine ligase